MEVSSARDVGKFLIEIKKEASQNEGHAVYVLECVQPYPDDEKMGEILRQRYTSSRTNAIDSALFADTVYYVGETNDLVRRVSQHLGGHGSSFTAIFRPQSLERIEWCDSREAAEQRESELVEELNNMVGVIHNIADSSLTSGISEDHIPEWRLQEVRDFYGRSGSTFEEERKMLYAMHLAGHQTNHGSEEEIREVAEGMLAEGLPEIVYAYGL